MPNKPTKRERKDEAKRRRLEEMRRRQRRARMRKIYTYSVVGLIIAALAGIVLINRAGAQRVRAAAARLAASAGCEAPKEFPLEPSDHIAAGERATFKTDPPTSGRHWNQQQPIPSPNFTGIHPQSMPDESMVHNLEHGHVAILYREGSLPDDVKRALEKVVFENRQWALIAPRANRNDDLAIVAWGIKQDCANPNANVEKVAREFIKRFRNKGPESVPGQPSPTTPSVAPTASPTGSPAATGTARPTGTTRPTGTARPTGGATASGTGTAGSDPRPSGPPTRLPSTAPATPR